MVPYYLCVWQYLLLREVEPLHLDDLGVRPQLRGQRVRHAGHRRRPVQRGPAQLGSHLLHRGHHLGEGGGKENNIGEGNSYSDSKGNNKGNDNLNGNYCTKTTMATPIATATATATAITSTTLIAAPPHTHLVFLPVELLHGRHPLHGQRPRALSRRGVLKN